MQTAGKDVKGNVKSTVAKQTNDECLGNWRSKTKDD